MAEIREEHVEWRVVARLHELLKQLPDTDHDVTLTYSLFSTILCWTCQKIRSGESDAAHPVWQNLKQERAIDAPWLLSDLKMEVIDVGESIEALPASVFLVSLRNAIAHGDERRVRPLHHGEKGKADRRLTGFILELDLVDQGQKRNEAPRWGRHRISMNQIDLRRIGMALADRFVSVLSAQSQEDARRHVFAA